MANPTFYTRIQLKYDELATWQSKNPILLKGEIALVEIPSGATGTPEVNPPSILMKIGDGVFNAEGTLTGTQFNNLPWLSAKAADVHAWAKKSESEFTSWLVKTIENGGVGLATKEELATVSGAVEAVAGRVTTLETDLNTATTGIKARLTAVEGVAKANGEAITAIKDGASIDSFKDVEEALALKATVEALNAEKDRAEKAEKANADAITAIKDDANIDSFADVVAELAKKQDTGDYATKAEAKGYADAKDTAIEAAQSAADKAQGEVDDLEEYVGTFTHETATTVVEYVNAVVTAEKTRAEGIEGGLETRLAAVEGDYLVEADKTELQGNINTVAGDLTKEVTRATEAEGAIVADMGDVDSLSTTAKTVVGAIEELKVAIGAGGTAAAVTMSTDTTTDGALKSYTIKQGDAVVGTIDIPKDMVVESGEVVTNPEGQSEGTYIKLKLANVEAPLYINVGTLVDIYKAKAEAAQVQVVIDSATREISASIVAGSIGTTELADNAVTTAKIADSNVTLAKLSSSVQTSLGKADSAVQTVAEGATNGTIAVDGTDVAVHGLGSAAFVDTTAFDAAGSAKAVQDDLDAYKESNDAAVAQALTDAKKYADDLDKAMDERVDALEAASTSLTLDKVGVNEKANYVIFNCGSATEMI